MAAPKLKTLDLQIVGGDQARKLIRYAVLGTEKIKISIHADQSHPVQGRASLAMWTGKEWSDVVNLLGQELQSNTGPYGKAAESMFAEDEARMVQLAVAILAGP